MQEEDRTDAAEEEKEDEEEENPAKKRQEKKERVDKPGPHTIDQDQDDAAHEERPLDTPR